MARCRKTRCRDRIGALVALASTRTDGRPTETRRSGARVYAAWHSTSLMHWSMSVYCGSKCC